MKENLNGALCKELESIGFKCRVDDFSSYLIVCIEDVGEGETYDFRSSEAFSIAKIDSDLKKLTLFFIDHKWEIECGKYVGSDYGRAYVNGDVEEDITLEYSFEGSHRMTECFLNKDDLSWVCSDNSTPSVPYAKYDLRIDALMQCAKHIIDFKSISIPKPTGLIAAPLSEDKFGEKKYLVDFKTITEDKDVIKKHFLEVETIAEGLLYEKDADFIFKVSVEGEDKELSYLFSYFINDFYRPKTENKNALSALKTIN